MKVNFSLKIERVPAIISRLFPNCLVGKMYTNYPGIKCYEQFVDKKRKQNFRLHRRQIISRRRISVKIDKKYQLTFCYLSNSWAARAARLFVRIVLPNCHYDNALFQSGITALSQRREEAYTNSIKRDCLSSSLLKTLILCVSNDRQYCLR